MLRRSLAGAGRFLESEWFTYRQTWRASVFSAFLSPLLYLGAIGFGLGSLVEGGGSLGESGGEAVSYVTFLAPGLIAATGLQVGTGEAIYGTMAGVEWRKSFFTAVGTPLQPLDVALGHLGFTAVRGGLAALAYAVVTSLLGILSPLVALLAVLPAVLGGLALSSAVMSWIVITKNQHSINAAQRFIVIPMFLFSGVFFPITQLPGWMQPIAQATPLWHAVELARLVTLGQPSAWTPSLHVLFLVVFLAAGVAASARLFPRRLTS